MPTTKLIDNFSGRLTRDSIGDMNSGLAKYATTYGNDPFSNIGNLTWLENAVQIDSQSSVMTDLVMTARPRLESGITYVYGVGHLARIYKVQVNNPSTFNPNYDIPAFVASIASQTPTFKYGSSIQFFGATEKLYIGHDKGVTSINYDGSGEAFIGSTSSVISNVPRPSAVFLGKTYWGNGANLLEIDSSGTVTSYAKLSPGLPAGLFIRDLDVSPDGNYLQIIASRLNSPDLTSATQDTTSLSSADSYKLLWNGVDLGITSYETFSGYTINSNISFGNNSLTMGYDLGGSAIYSNAVKVISMPNVVSPNFEAMFSTGNLMGFAAPEATQ